MTVREIVGIIMIFIVFLSGFIPIVMGIIYYARENNRLDKEEREKAARSASHPI